MKKFIYTLLASTLFFTACNDVDKKTEEVEDIVEEDKKDVVLEVPGEFIIYDKGTTYGYESLAGDIKFDYDKMYEIVSKDNPNIDVNNNFIKITLSNLEYVKENDITAGVFVVPGEDQNLLNNFNYNVTYNAALSSDLLFGSNKDAMITEIKNQITSLGATFENVSEVEINGVKYLRTDCYVVVEGGERTYYQTQFHNMVNGQYIALAVTADSKENVDKLVNNIIETTLETIEF